MVHESLELSFEAQQVVAMKPPIWEYRLFFHVFKDEIAIARRLLQMASPVPRTQVSLLAFGSWAQARIEHIVSLLENISSLTNAENDDAFGPPGQPGDVDKIVFLSRRIAAHYRQIIDWVHSIRDAEVDPRLREGVDELSCSADQWLRAFERFGPDGLDSIEAALNSPPGSQQEVLVRLELLGTDLTKFGSALIKCLECIENSDDETGRVPMAITNSLRIEPRLLRSPRDFEAAAADWMRSWGFLEVRTTSGGPDGGIDVESLEAVAQVKAWMVPVGRPEIQKLKGAAYDGRTALFFSLMDYTTAAIMFADEASVALFRFSGYNGDVEPINMHARQFLAGPATASRLLAGNQTASRQQTNFGNDPESGSGLQIRSISKLIATSLNEVIDERRGFGIFSVRQTNRFVQFRLDDDQDILCVESVGNKFLPKHEVLTSGERFRLESLGWTLESDGNYCIDYTEPPFPLEQIVDLLTETLIEVHGVRTAMDLEVTVEIGE